MLQIILFTIILLIILHDIYFLYNYVPVPQENKKKIINDLKDKYKKLIELKKPNKINDIQYNPPQIKDTDTVNLRDRPPIYQNERNEIPQLIHPQMQRIEELQNINSQPRPDLDSDIDTDMEPTVINRDQKKVFEQDDYPDINKFGKPYEYEENKYIVWEFMDPEPWSRIVYRYNEEYPYQFYIKAKIPSLNDYENWKNIITNLQFNPRPGELIIPTKSEESAIAIANLIISNFGGSISLDDIIKKDLIGISIAKATKYEVVKNKLKEQIINMIKPPPLTSSVDFQQDLALGSSPFASVEQKKDIGAWEGSEFAFI